MSVPRLLLSCSIALVTAHCLRAEPTPVSQGAEKNGRNAPGESNITFNSVHVAGPYIAMTFDDGPSATLTPKLLDLLAAHHIKATFFVIGENVAEHPEIVERAAREGHEIANHSWSHPNFGKMSDEGVRRQLTRTDDAIKNATGVHVDPYDWKRPGPSVVCNRILKETRPGSIVLSHDIHPGTIEAMPSTFDQLQAKGFKFVTVSELIRMLVPQPPQPSTGTHVSVPATVAPSSSTSTIPSAESSPSH